MQESERNELIQAIKRATAQLFESACTEEEVRQLEQQVHHEVLYLAAVAQAELVKPEGGWDILGR